jgi:transposase
MTNSNSQTFNELKVEFERLREQMTPEVQMFNSLLFKLFEVVILSLPKNKATSANSNLPPSQDPFRKKGIKSENSKKPGGQKGHKGSSLVMDANPDKIIKHPAIECGHCGFNLANTPIDNISRHQVIDIKFKKFIIENQVEHKTCNCGHHQAHVSAGAPVQYGPGLKATAVELNQVQCVPFKRCAEFIQQKFMLSLSPATLVSFARQAGERLLIWEENIKADLLSSERLYADETGININAKNWWVHVLSNEHSTLMIVHQRRGIEAMIETEVLPHYHGILCHDFWSSYNDFDVIHAPCHSHLQRELKKVHEDYGQKWAADLAKLLVKAKNKREENDGDLSYEQIIYFEKRYSLLINVGIKKNPIQKNRSKQRGRIAQTYPRQLLNRLIKYRDWVLAFLRNPLVPFTNNQAERDIRMLKVQQKVSGYFKTEEGARSYCRIRSYILTMQKRGHSKHEALTLLFAGT